MFRRKGFPKKHEKLTFEQERKRARQAKCDYVKNLHQASEDYRAVKKKKKQDRKKVRSVDVEK